MNAYRTSTPDTGEKIKVIANHRIAIDVPLVVEIIGEQHHVLAACRDSDEGYS